MKKMFLPFLIITAMFCLGCGHKEVPEPPVTVTTPVKKDTVVTVPKEVASPPKPAKKKVRKDTSAGALPYESKFNQNYGRDGKLLYE